jgi:hypothetical protein
MGAIAEGILAYAQPLIDQTDGSIEQLNEALSISQLCYNLAISPEATRETVLRELRPSFPMDDDEFDAFLRELLLPMIRRHERMFPLMHRRLSAGRSSSGSSSRGDRISAEAAKTPPPSDRYAPCPCNSGRKYKFCCGAKGR